jgi:hypothetical protein
MRRFRAVPLLFLLPFIACGSGDPPPARSPAPEALPTAHGQGSAGTFELTISGDVADRFSGVSSFFTMTDEETGELGFFLVMNEDPDAEDGRTLMIGARGGRPAVGEHPFMDVEALGEDEDDLPPGQYSAQVYSPGGYMLHPRGGTLRITESTRTRLAGTLSFSALGVRFTGHPPAPTGAARVEGRFEATLVEVNE